MPCTTGSTPTHGSGITAPPLDDDRSRRDRRLEPRLGRTRPLAHARSRRETASASRPDCAPPVGVVVAVAPGADVGAGVGVPGPLPFATSTRVSRSCSASGAFVGAESPVWLSVLMPWQLAQTRISPDWKLSQLRSRTTPRAVRVGELPGERAARGHERRHRAVEPDARPRSRGPPGAGDTPVPCIGRASTRRPGLCAGTVAVAAHRVGLEDLQVGDVVDRAAGRDRRDAAGNAQVERLLAVGAVALGHVAADDQRELVLTENVWKLPTSTPASANTPASTAGSAATRGVGTARATTSTGIELPERAVEAREHVGRPPADASSVMPAVTVLAGA